MEHQPAMEVECCGTDGPRVRGRQISCLEDGDMVIMDQRPTSVTSQ